jgi:hypothetical protein
VLGRDGPLNGGGSFEVEVPTGRSYELMAFLDEDGDSTWAEPEIMLKREGGVSLQFVSKEQGLQFDLRPAEAPEDLEIPGTREALGEVTAVDSTEIGGVTAAGDSTSAAAETDSTQAGDAE